jgi:hypothetical protein
MENVCVTIINSTGLSLEKVELQIGGISKDSIGYLEPDKQACLSFRGSGESVFRLKAILTNGKTVVSGDEYSEGGYKFVGTVTHSIIKIEL